MRCEFWIDRGGTFTDCILFERETGERRVTKVLSSDDAPLIGIRELLGLGASDPIPPCDVRMGTTVATNALLERKGAHTALVISKGFADLLEIGNQTRPELFSLDIKKPEQLYKSVFETSARLSPQGKQLAWPGTDEVRQLALHLAQTGVKSVALVVLHAYANPDLEEALARSIATAWPEETPLPSFTWSTDSACEQGLLARASTTVLDAYITPLLKDYLAELGAGLPGSTLRLMQSSGGLASASRFRGPEAILSGPAGGIVAGERIAHALGSKRVVTFDMGGTSTDVSLIEETALLKYETTVGGVFLRAPMLDIHTIAAGGGSQCSFDGYGLTVGPNSVGASPGPLCYGNQDPEQAPGWPSRT